MMRTRACATLLGVATAAACRDPVAPDTGAGSGATRAVAPGAIAPLDAAASAPEPAPVARGARTIVLPEPAIVLPQQESFQLLAPGRGRRAILRYRVIPGTTIVTARTVLASRQLAHGVFTPPAQLPAIRDGFAIAISGAADRVTLRALVADAAAQNPETAAYLATWRRELEGRQITLAIDDRGGFGAIAFSDDPSGARSARARDELTDRLLSRIAPLPTEPVGLGARWRVVTILRQGPAVAKQTATYTLVARGAAGWKLHLALQRVAEQQAIIDPTLPPGTTAELIALFRSLEGEIEIDPRLPLVAGGSLTVESRLHARVSPPAASPQPAASPLPTLQSDQMFEDTGRVNFARCRPSHAAALGDAAPHAATLPASCSDAAAR